jgi:hypothetical protein
MSWIAACRLALSLAPFAALATGCAAGPASDTGTLQIPLSEPGPDGAIYHLEGSFQFTGPQGITQVDDVGSDPSVTVELTPGLYEVQLLDGWLLERSGDGGATYDPISAIIGSLNPVPVRVLGNQPAAVNFQFLMRNADGELVIAFGVSTVPRELAGGMVISTGTGQYADYSNRTVDYAVYYDLAATTRTTAADGTRDAGYTAGFVGGEFFNDTAGILSSQGPAIAGGTLEYHLAVNPDGSQVLTGRLETGNFPDTILNFGPRTLDTPLAVDADGFAVDGFLFDSFVPFTLTTLFDSTGGDTLTGQMRFRSLPQVGAGS